MKNLLISDRKKIQILETLSDLKVHTFYHVSKVTKTNYNTVKKNCRFLELLNLVEINILSKEDSASEVPSFRVRITQEGLKTAKNIHHRLHQDP